MLIDDIKLWIHAAPFVPFLIHTTGGKSFTVDHPELVNALEKTPLLEVFLPDGNLALVEPYHVTHLETIAASNASE